MVTTQIQFGDIGVVAPLEAANFEVDYPAPAWAEKDLLVYPCPEGEEDVLGTCVPCQPGHYRDANLLQCKPCPSGTFTAANGTGRCSLCEKGTFGASEGLTACEDCHIGHAAVEKGMPACPACRPGHFMNETGAAECFRCPEATFADGIASIACTACSGGKGTRGLGAIDESECICMPNEYFRPGYGCVTCSVGLDCPGGNEAPTQQEGHYVEILDEESREYHVFQCQNPALCQQETSLLAPPPSQVDLVRFAVPTMRIQITLALIARSTFPAALPLLSSSVCTSSAELQTARDTAR